MQASLTRRVVAHAPAKLNRAPVSARVVRPAKRAQRVQLVVSAALREAPKSSASPVNLNSEDLFNSAVECPHGSVQGIIDQPERPPVLTAKPNQSMQSIIPLLSKVTGLPVVDKKGSCVGVISRKDIIKVRQEGGTLEARVDEHMTKPALTIAANTPVKEAADLMLQKKIRRLPVVDANGAIIGVVSRSDIFKPLMRAKYDAYMNTEVAAMVSGEGLVFNWEIKYLYDGDCAMCQSLKAVLTRQDRRQKIKFVNIADHEYDPSTNMGIEFDEAMDTIHAVRPDGTVLLGTEALRALFDTVGLGWAVQLSELPIVTKLFELIYNFLSANRMEIGGLMDGVIAVKRMELSKKEVTTCGDIDEGCHVEW